MKFTRRIIAALLVLAWLFAGAHVALEHGGETFGWHTEAVDHGHDHDHDDDAHHHHDDSAPVGGDHHHHDLSAASTAQLTKTGEGQSLAPVWVPLYDQLLLELASLLKAPETVETNVAIGDSPPDTRLSGWLFVVQTALQVRGPSLVA